MASCGTENTAASVQTGDDHGVHTPNYGYQVLIKCAPQIIQGLSRQPAAAATLLLSRGLVSKELVEEVVDLPHTKTHNGRKLYTAVLNVVRCYPNRYTDFTSVLEEDTLLYSDLLTDLREAYRKADPYAQNEPSLTLPQTPPTKQLTEETAIANEERVITDIAAKVDILESKFLTLVDEAFEQLVTKNITLDYFYAKVSCMKNTLKKVASKYFEESFGKVVALSSFQLFWGKLNHFWDFFNYELLQHVIRVMFTEADHPLLSQLAEYEDEIGRFLSSTKLCHFFKVWPFSTGKPQEKEVAQLRRVVVRVNRKWEDCTLQDVKNISNTFAQGFFLPREFLLLAGVGKSSVSLLWYVPPSLASSIEEKVKEKNDFLSDNGFLSITIDDLQVYPLTLMRQCSLHLQRFYELSSYCKSKEIIKHILIPFKLTEFNRKKNYITYEQDITVSSLGTCWNGYPARLVLLEGAPGSGKTTFSFDAVLKWTRNEILTHISLLALFPLRDYNLRKINNLLELLALITPDHELLMKELEANKGEGMAFWFDGWDEIVSSLDGHSSIYEQLVSGEILPKARVIVTSRSWATDYIRKQLEQQPSQHIEIVSSYHDQIDWLMELKMKELPMKLLSMIDDFLKYLEEAPAIQGNMHTPLATQITLEVYQWSQKSGSPLPTTVTQPYTSYTCLCIHNYLDNHSHFQLKMWKTNNFRDLPEPLHSWFFSLCRLAFDGLEDGQRLVFPDVPNHLRLETLGLMQAQAPLYVSDKSAVVSYHYKHLTLQEFLSALLLSWMSDEERSETVERCISDGRYTMTLRFLFGLTKSSPILRDHMRRMLAFNIDKDKLTIFHWLFEGSNKVFTTDILRERKMRVHSYFSWSALDYFVTAHCIARSNCSWDIDFSNSRMGDEKMTQFLQALSSADGEQGDPHITSINWSSNKLTSQSLCHLQDIPAHYLHHLKSFDIHTNKLDHIAMNHIAKTIPYMPLLEEFDLRDNRDIQRGGAVSLISALCNHKTLRSLKLQNTNIGEEDCEQLTHLLSSCQCLEELNVHNNPHSSDSIHCLFNGLQQSKSLKTLSLSSHVRTNISLENIKTLSAYLYHKNCKLKRLDLSDNKISGDEETATLGQAMAKNKTITTLMLARCGITATGGIALTSFLIVNSTTEELDISGNALGQAIPTFAQLLQHNKRLKRLDIHNDDSLRQSDMDTLLGCLMNNQTLQELALLERLRVDTDRRVLVAVITLNLIYFVVHLNVYPTSLLACTSIQASTVLKYDMYSLLINYQLSFSSFFLSSFLCFIEPSVQCMHYLLCT